MNGATTVSVVGVGGQGVILGAAVLANAAMIAGFDVKASEVKGMAQRGGSVFSTVRFGRQVWSPVSAHADVVVATELLEGRRTLELLAAGGALVFSTAVIAPGSVLRGEKPYPGDIEAAAAALGVRLLGLDAEALAAAAGTIRVANVALLGAASTVLPFEDEHWQKALQLVVPGKTLEANRHAFELGRDTVSQEVGG